MCLALCLFWGNIKIDQTQSLCPLGIYPVRQIQQNQISLVQVVCDKCQRSVC